MTFREHVYPPASWLIIGGLFSLSTAYVMLIWLGPWWASGVLVGLTALIGGWFASTTLRITVDADALRVNHCHLTWPYVGEVSAMDRLTTNAILGPEADACAWVAMPPFANRAVQVTVDDCCDPHPYWVIGTRRPEELAHAISTQGKCND